MVNAEELIEELCKRYDTKEDNDSGCYYNGRWLSIAHIVEIIKEMDIY